MNDQHPNQSPQIEGKGPYGGLSATSPKLLLQGLDSLYVCYNFDLAFSGIDFMELEQSKQFARNRDQSKAIIDLGSERFAILPYGQQRYPYLLSGKNFSFALAERTRPSLKVQFRSEALWRDGAQTLYNRVLAWADTLNVVTLKTEKVIRADWAFDFDLPKIDLTEDQFVTLADVTPERVVAFTAALRTRLQDAEHPQFRRAYLRLLLDKVVVGKDVIRISGPKTALAQQLTSERPVAPSMVPIYMDGWCSEQSQARSAQLEFPDNRVFTGKTSKNRPNPDIASRQSHVFSMSCRTNSLRDGTGNFF